jgi:CSLREA domain-containing protein
MSRTTNYLMRSLMLLMLAALVASVVAVVLASPAQAATSTVTTAADEQNTDAQCSLREAIINANQNDQSGSTDCAAGVGEDTINFNLGSTATITLGSPLPVIAGFHPAGLIIDGGSANITISGDNKYPVFQVAFVENTLSNLTVANGEGAGIYNGGTLTVSNSTISGNSGTGISNGGTLTVSNSTLSGNSASFGGGGIINGGTLEVNNSTLSGNSALFGGGIYNGGTLTVSNSTLSGNSATSATGGGIMNTSRDTLTVSNSTLSGNSAFFGGGIFINSGDRPGPVTVSNSTISENSASIAGGIDIRTFQGATFKNTIVAANDASLFVPDMRGGLISQGHNLIGQSECTVGCFTNEDLVGTAANPIDPMLGPLANNGGPTMTHALLEGSPAIDKGVAVEGITTDQRGFARQQGAAPDIGAFESEFVDTLKPHVSTATPTGTGIARGTNIAATFSEEVQQATLTTANVQLFSGNSKMPAKATLSKTSTSVTLVPSSKLDANTTYRAVVGTGVQDLAGNALDQDQNPNNGNQPQQWTFTTGPK